jgi:hypothetical protein
MSEANTCNMDIIDFNQRVIDAHNAHYTNNPDGLIDRSKNASPNGNQIYHLYSSGEITYQKGAWAYLQRSEFHCEYDISGARKLPFKFVKDAADGTTYAILTQEECKQFREEMKKYIK